MFAGSSYIGLRNLPYGGWSVSSRIIIMVQVARYVIANSWGGIQGNGFGEGGLSKVASALKLGI